MKISWCTLTNLDQDIKDIYYKEIERKDSINNAISIQIGIITLGFGANYSLIHNLDEIRSFSFWYEISLITFSVVFLAATTCFIFISNWSYKYKYIPYAGDLLKYKAQLLESKNEFLHAEDLAEKETIKYLHSQYAECADHNAVVHKKVALNIFRAKVALIASISLLFLASIPIGWKIVSKPEKIQKIEITNIKELKMQDNEPTSSPPAPPPPPPPPPSRIERGAFNDPPKPKT